MKSKWILLLTAIPLLLCAASLATGSNGATHFPAQAKPGATTRKSMQAMVDSSRLNCKTTSDTLDKLLITFAEARKSGDKDKMSTALALAENHIFGMKAEMSRCVNRLEMMGGRMAGKNNADTFDLSEDGIQHDSDHAIGHGNTSSPF